MNHTTLTFIFLILNSLGLAAQSKTPSKVIRVLSYNIYHGETVAAEKRFDLDLLAHIIKSANPDLVALQEVDFKTKRARNIDLVTALGWRTKMAPLFGKAMPYDGGEYGEGILSKKSFIATKNHPLKARKGKEPRAALEVLVQIKSGDTIRFIGTHLDHTDDETDRIQQAKAINELVINDAIPTILAGDLNAIPTSKTMSILFSEWTPSSRNFEPTIPVDTPTKRIDYILFRPQNRWRVLETTVIPELIGSDHRPVLSVLELLD